MKGKWCNSLVLGCGEIQKSVITSMVQPSKLRRRLENWPDRRKRSLPDPLLFRPPPRESLIASKLVLMVNLMIVLYQLLVKGMQRMQTLLLYWVTIQKPLYLLIAILSLTMLWLNCLQLVWLILALVLSPRVV